MDTGRKYFVADSVKFQEFLASLNQSPKATLADVRTEIEATYGTDIPQSGLTVFEIASEVVKKQPRVVKPNGFEFQSQRKLGPRGPRKPKDEANAASATDTPSAEDKPARKSRKHAE